MSDCGNFQNLHTQKRKAPEFLPPNHPSLIDGKFFWLYFEILIRLLLFEPRLCALRMQIPKMEKRPVYLLGGALESKIHFDFVSSIFAENWGKIVFQEPRKKIETFLHKFFQYFGKFRQNTQKFFLKLSQIFCEILSLFNFFLRFFIKFCRIFCSNFCIKTLKIFINIPVTFLRISSILQIGSFHFI